MGANSERFDFYELVRINNNYTTCSERRMAFRR